MTIERTARCTCGALQIRCSGKPVRRSVCHCEACRHRTGSIFSYNITYDAAQVEPSGEARTYMRQADSGRTCTYSFCPACGATVYYTLDMRPGKVSVPGGGFPPNSFEPSASVYNARRERWIEIRPSGGLVEES